MQILRHVVRTVLPLAGIFVAFAGVLYVQGDLPRLMAVLLGILLVEAGAWNMANAILPSSRRYLELREEVGKFVGRIPELNSTAVEARSSNARGDWEAYERVVADLHAIVDRMGAVAGKEEGMDDTRSPLRDADRQQADRDQNDHPV